MYPRFVVIVVTCAVLLAGAPSAGAHLVDGLNIQSSKASARRTARVIHEVFDTRREAHEAQRVVACESAFQVKIKSSNDLYWGLFQMGEWARENYNWGWRRRAQTKASFRYYVDSGRDWSPWASCAP